MEFDLRYVRCVKYTPGQLDRAPFSEYVWTTVRATMWRIGPVLGWPEDTFEIQDTAGNWLGSGETKDDAIFDSRYRLMDKSRTAAEYAAV